MLPSMRRKEFSPRMTASFHENIKNGNLVSVHEALKNGADVNARGTNDFMSLHFANQNIETTKLLLDHGANVHAVDQWGRTPLFGAAQEVVPLLIGAGADVQHRDKDGIAPIAV